MIVLHQPVSEQHKMRARVHLEEVIQILSKPNGFAKLSTTQRKFLMAVVLASIVPADMRIRNIELEKLQLLLRNSLHVTGDVALESMAVAESQAGLGDDIETIARALPDLLGIEDRCTMISHLWDLALCDHELHTFEEKMVYKIADLSGVPRKKVAELMAKSAARS